MVFYGHDQPVFVRLFQQELPVERLHEAGVDHPDLHAELGLYRLGGFERLLDHVAERPYRRGRVGFAQDLALAARITYETRLSGLHASI